MFTFLDRVNERRTLSSLGDETIEGLLLRHRIPSASVVVFVDGVPVPDTAPVDPGKDYEAHLIEGYDIGAILAPHWAEPATPDIQVAYVKKLLQISRDGDLATTHAPLSLEHVSEHVEQTVAETCREFRLIEEGDRVLLGLSGGVDSGSLLLALAAARNDLPSFELAAVTFEDFDSHSSPTFQQARDVAAKAGVAHYMVPSSLVESVFHLNAPLPKILPALMETASAHFAMYVDHHTTRRALEVFAEQNGYNKIALGLHTTDLVAGLLNGVMTGYTTADLPRRQVGKHAYIFPLAFVQKRELHLFQLQRMGRLSKHSFPNAWERKPMDRNFYYYLSDLLQSFWPGLEVMMFLGHSQRLTRQPSLKFEECPNCGSALLQQPFTVAPGSECDACILFKRYGYIDGEMDDEYARS